MSAPRQMKLNAFIHATGHHVAAWRHPQSQADAGVNFHHYVELARTAERAKFDGVAVRDQNVETASPAACYVVRDSMVPLELKVTLGGKFLEVVRGDGS